MEPPFQNDTSNEPQAAKKRWWRGRKDCDCVKRQAHRHTIPTHTNAAWINISPRCDVSLFSWDPRGSTGRGVRDRSAANWFHQIPTSKERLRSEHWGLLTFQWGLNPKLNLNPKTVSGIQSAREPVWSSGRWVGVKAILMSCSQSTKSWIIANRVRVCRMEDSCPQKTSCPSLPLF